MTSSTETEVQNIAQNCRSSTKPSQFGHVVSEICQKTTDSHHNTSHASQSKVISSKLDYCTLHYKKTAKNINTLQHWYWNEITQKHHRLHQKNGKKYSSLQLASLLRELTCHMGSHSITCHLAEVAFLPLPHTHSHFTAILDSVRDYLGMNLDLLEQKIVNGSGIS